MTIETIIFISTVLYILIYLSFVLNISFDDSLNTIDIDSSNSKPISISIIVPAKDEEKNIQNLIEALKNLAYPKLNYEVIIVDDNSFDDTFNIATNITNKLENFTIISVADKKYEGKRGALDYGILQAKFPNIALTDADCTPEKNWLKCLSSKLADSCDFVFGIAPFYQTNQLVNKVSCFENFRNSLLAISAANYGLAYTASARNFGFRKDAFGNIGGYNNTTDTISGDDDLLLREAVKNVLKVCTLTSVGSFVYSETKETFKDYFSQRARHTQTSLHYPLKQKLFLGLWHLINITLAFSPVFIFINTIFILPFIIKLLFDTVTSVIYIKRFGYKFFVFEIVYLQLIYEVLLIVHFIKANFGKIEWR